MPWDTLGDMFSQTGLAAQSMNQAQANPPQAPLPVGGGTGGWTGGWGPGAFIDAVKNNPTSFIQTIAGSGLAGGMAAGNRNYGAALEYFAQQQRLGLAQQEMALRNQAQSMQMGNTMADIMMTAKGMRKPLLQAYMAQLRIDPKDPQAKLILDLASQFDDEEGRAAADALRQLGIETKDPAAFLRALSNPVIVQFLKGMQEDKRLKSFNEAVQQLEGDGATPESSGTPSAQPQSGMPPLAPGGLGNLLFPLGPEDQQQQSGAAAPIQLAQAQDTPERRAALLVNAESNLKKAEDNFDRLTKLQARATKVLPPGPEREKYLADLRLRVQAADSDRKHFDSQVTTITNQIETDKRTREFRQEAEQRAREFHADTQANRQQLTEMQRQREEDRRQRELDKIVPGWFWDKTTGESRHDVTVGELRANKQNFHGMTQSQKDAHDLLVPAQKQIDGLRSLINRVLAANPGQQLYKIMQNYAKSKYQTDPDLTQLLQLSQSVALEQTRAVAGTTRPAIALFNAIQGKETPGISMTAEVANRVLDTTENNINNRLAQIRGEPLKDLPTNQPSGVQMPAGITVRRVR